MNYQGHSAAVREDLVDLRDGRNLLATLREFSQKLTEMSAELDRKAKTGEITSHTKNEIISGYAENFIYSVVQILVKAERERSKEIDRANAEPVVS